MLGEGDYDLRVAVVFWLKEQLNARIGDDLGRTGSHIPGITTLL